MREKQHTKSSKFSELQTHEASVPCHREQLVVPLVIELESCHSPVYSKWWKSKHPSFISVKNGLYLWLVFILQPVTK